MSDLLLNDRIFNLTKPTPDPRDYPVILFAGVYPPAYKPAQIESVLDQVMINQGRTGSCAGQSLAKMLTVITFNQQNSVYQYSPYWLWLNRFLAFDGRDDGEGTNPAMQALMAKNEGVCLHTQYQPDIENNYKYSDLDDEFYGFVKPAFEKTAKIHAPDAYAVPKNELEVKQAIMDNGSCLIGVLVHSGWNSIDDTGIIPNKKPEDTEIGGHAMVIYGWDDSRRVWFGHNSWGKSWGKNGFFEIPMDAPFYYLTFLDATKLHWAHKYYYYLWSKGLKLSDQRFDENITRGEVIALLAKSMGCTY